MFKILNNFTLKPRFQNEKATRNDTKTHTVLHWEMSENTSILEQKAKEKPFEVQIRLLHIDMWIVHLA